MQGAAEIRWNPWEPAVFERARAEGRLVFLDISASWCHWCHVLDRTSLSDPRVASLLGASYVPVRVDTDRRPDVNERYNQGGWPTTAILLPDGRLLAGATYLPPDDLLDFLSRCAAYYRAERGRLEQAAGESGDPPGMPGAADPGRARGSPPPGDLALVGHAVLARYDPVHPGFFREPKFLATEILAFLRDAWIVDGNRETGETLLAVLRRMSASGVHDAVGGGFFRYATRRDWTEPHYEKRLGDNAEMLDLYASAMARSAEPSLSGAARGILGFLLGTLHDPETGGFFSSQDADEAYYRLPAGGRALRPAPAVDRTVISEYNAAAVSALAAAHGVFPGGVPGAGGPGELLGRAERLGRYLRETLWSREEGQVRFRDGGAAEAGHLADNIAVATAHLDLRDATGDPEWLEFAVETLDWTVRRLYSANSCGFLDRRPRAGEPAGFGIPVVPFAGNARAASALVRCAREAVRPDLFAVAEQVLERLSGECDARAAFAAPYGSALLRYGSGRRGLSCAPGDAACR